MKKLIFAFFLSVSFFGYADGNEQAGRQKSAVCSACHGAQGISTNPEWPNLAGQHVSYLVKQLRDLKEANTRSSITMSPMAANLSDDDMQDIATFYSKQPLAEAQTASQEQKRGEELYHRGDFKKHIPACIACHGPKGTGNAQAGFPVLSGQHAQYAILQLQAFKEKKRTNDLNHIMQDIAAKMDEKDMEAVAHYIAGLK